jgi:hypothetical protein
VSVSPLAPPPAPLDALAPDPALLDASPVVVEPPTPLVVDIVDVVDDPEVPCPVVTLDEVVGAAPPGPGRVSSPQAAAAMQRIAPAVSLIRGLKERS